MCIIVSKEKYKKIPKKTILENCFDNNPDGAGFMYTYNNKVIIEKGFFTFDEFYNRLMEVDKILNLYKKSLVMHFRIGTSGGINAETCHPFPISNKENDLKDTQLLCNLGMVHNGVISNFVYGKLSDTQNFVKDFVYPLSKVNGNFLNNKYALDLLYNQCGYTKLCFLDKNDDIIYVGKFVEDNGIKYSNTTYKESKYYYVPNTKYGKYYDDYYDYYEEKYYKKKNNNYGIKDNEYHWLNKKKIKKLDTNMVFYDNYLFDMQKVTDDMYIDENYDVYELVEEFTDFIKGKLIAEDVVLYKDENNFEELTFAEINNKEELKNEK